MRKSKFLFFVLILFMSVSFIFADYYYEQQKINSGPRGEKTSLSKTWITNGKIRVDEKDSITIVDTAKNSVIIINPNNKTYSQMTLDRFRDMVLVAMKNLKKFMKSNNNGVKITVTGETKVIGGYPCYKVIMDMFGMKTINWYTKKIDIPKDVYLEFSKLTMTKEDFDAMVNNPEFKKIQGFPVESIRNINIMGINMKKVTKLIKFAKMSIPSSIFNYNLSGFTKIEVNMGKGGM